MRASPTSDDSENVLPDLHRTLLRNCATWGNVTAALRICEDIQYLSTQLSWSDSGLDAPELPTPAEGVKMDGSTLLLDPQNLAAAETVGTLGLRVPEWKSLLVAAAKAGHWRVCLSTLQFLRPYLENTRPSHVRNSRDRKRLMKKYRSLAPALSTAVSCLSDNKQYAWAIRVIDDWTTWAQRRPPRQAVLTVTRLLSSQGQGEEANRLLARCMALPVATSGKQATLADERMLYVGAISALYSDGLYDAADEAFVSAVSRGCLPFNLEKQEYSGENCFTLDLHGMNVAVAHSAVRIALQQEVLTASWNNKEVCDTDMIIVTGRGRKSALQMRPVLRPEVQRMLVEEFYPPLGTTSVPGNMGALRVDSSGINDWLSHQRQQKGAQMLSVAAVLKNLTSGSRLKAALKKSSASSREDGPLDAEGGASPPSPTGS